MSDQPSLPPVEEPVAPAVAASSPAQRNLLPWLGVLGFLVLAAAIFYTWQNPSTRDDTLRNAVALQTLEQHLASADARLGQLEQRPMPDVAKLTARVDSFEGRIPDLTQIPSHFDALSGRIESLSARDQTAVDATKTALDSTKRQLDALASRITALEANAGGVDAVTKRLNRIAKLQDASLALAAGRPVGDLANAPAALSRYAHVAPPTEAQLRLEFPKSARSALSAKQPDESSEPFIGRVLERAQGMLTIRQGGNLVVGNTSAEVLNTAQAALDAGDLPAAVQAVEALKGEPSQAMAGWLEEAKALLSARAALANMTDQA